MLRVHFLNVGHGDCTVIEHPSGRITVIDINNSQLFDQDTFNEIVLENELRGMSMESASLEAEATAKRELTDPIAFLQKKFPNKRPFRFILTHPDMDHMRGLKNLHEHIGFTNFWDTANTKEAPSKFKGNADEEDWQFYQRIRNGAVSPLYVKKYLRGDSHFAFGMGENGEATAGDNIEILSPTLDLVNDCNRAAKSNDLSYVIRVTHAGKSILLPGDAEEKAWDLMLEKYGRHLKSDFLKASHHGRDSGYHLDALKAISPAMTFVSVGRKPATDASSKYARYSKRVLSTRHHGNLTLTINDDGTFSCKAQRNAD
ncbi:beta-lactamase domain protein [Paraburkholderia caribensis MBA4]|uniref:Beta-lactamase domain protein n=2 Tax=Paraburkholderia caribensis TaxID=75105 RepID=A0A0N7JV79_9BURK|nr:beta-lactamase domain protein [Paraburkholderia caribensis MBA4]